ncbi:hypothetical protein [Caminibacter sp.]
MEMNQIENTLKKMGLVLEKLVQKIDELDKRVAKIEEKVGVDEKKFSSADLKTEAGQNQKVSTSSPLSGGFGSSFLGSMAGAMAGMGLYNLLFNHSVSPVEMGHTLGMDESEIQNVLEEDISEIDSKLDEIDSKLDELDEKIDSLSNEDVMNTDYFESYEEEDLGSDFGGGFDDFDGFDDV